MTKPADQLSYAELAEEITKGCDHFWSKRGGDPYGHKWVNPFNPHQKTSNMKPLCPTCNGTGRTPDLDYCPECGGDGLAWSNEDQAKPSRSQDMPKTYEQAIRDYKTRTKAKRRAGRFSRY